MNISQRMQVHKVSVPENEGQDYRTFFKRETNASFLVYLAFFLELQHTWWYSIHIGKDLESGRSYPES